MKEIPEDFEYVPEESSDEKLVFKKKKCIDVEDLGLISGFYVSGDCTIRQVHNISPTENDRNIWPCRAEADASLVLAELCQWRDKFNRIHEGDICFHAVCMDDNLNLFVEESFRGPLIFHSKELAEEFIEEFHEKILGAEVLL